MTPKQRKAADHRRAFAKLVGETLVDAIRAELPALIARQVEERVARLRVLRHVGVWGPGATYQEQDCVTCDGSMWVARDTSVNRKPGTDDGAAVWSLVVKRGKDGRP